MRLFILILTTYFSTSAYSDYHGSIPAGDGAFVALMVQAQDPAAYIAALKKQRSL